MKPQVLRKALWAANVVLLVLVISSGVRVFGRGRPGSGESGLTLSAVPVRPSTHADRITQEEAEAITASGTIVPVPEPPPEPTPAAPPPPPPPVDVAKTFGYRLIGTAFSVENPCAFFEDLQTRRQTVKSEGEEIDGARVVSIHEDRVIIEKGGRQGSIFPSKPLVGPVTARTEASAESTRPAATVVSSVPTIDDDDIAAEEEYEEWDEELDWMVMSEDTFRDYLTNIGKYINEIVIQSHLDEEKQIDGLILTKVPKDSEAYRRGLRAGDIVKEIQGEAITDTTAAYKVLHEVLTNEDYIVDVVLVRNGIEEIITYEIWPE